MRSKVGSIAASSAMREDGANAAASNMYANNQIPLIYLDEVPWFVAKDVSAALTLGNVTDSTQNLGISEVQNYRVPGTRGRPYKLIMRSDKPEARHIKDRLEEDGEPWFVVADVCKALQVHKNPNGYLNVSAALRNVNTNDVTLNRIQRMGNKRRLVKLVSESGAASGSKQPQKLHRAAVRLTESVCGAGTTCTP